MQDLNWYGKQSDAEGLRLGSLAVTAPMIEKMKVVEIINQHLLFTGAYEDAEPREHY